MNFFGGGGSWRVGKVQHGDKHEVCNHYGDKSEIKDDWTTKIYSALTITISWTTIKTTTTKPYSTMRVRLHGLMSLVMTLRKKKISQRNWKCNWRSWEGILSPNLSASLATTFCHLRYIHLIRLNWIGDPSKRWISLTRCVVAGSQKVKEDIHYISVSDQSYKLVLIKYIQLNTNASRTEVLVK